MKRIFTAFALAATLGVAALATSSPADAWWGWRGGGWGWGWRGCCWGPGPWVAGAVVGGAAVGAAVAASRPYYYGGYYYPYGAYPYYGPGCRRVWNGYYWVRACY
jgi:hypothetical protein